MTIPIYQVDAFADAVFKGNPAAVIPLEGWPEDALLQAIAAENNLSETAFFVRTDEGYHLRWFTPEYEIDLCGHATLASAYVIKNFIEPHLAQIRFTTKVAGVLTARTEGGVYTLDFPSRPPEACEVPPALLSSIGSPAGVVEVLRSRDYFVVLADESAVLSVEPDWARMSEVETIGVIVTARGTSADVVSRCFYPGAGIPEDPVTGSAHCNIVPYWAGKLGKGELDCLQASARGGRLQCRLNGDRVEMSGSAVLYMKGEVYV